MIKYVMYKHMNDIFTTWNKKIWEKLEIWRKKILIQLEKGWELKEIY